MTPLILYGELTMANIEAFLYKLQEHVITFGNDSEINIYVNSEGGEVRASQLLAHYFNNSPLKIKLIALEYISSSALFLFIEFNGKKEILSNTWGLLHLGSSIVETRELRNQKSLDSFRKKVANSEDLHLLNKLSNRGLEPGKLKDLKAGRDVLLTEEELRKLVT